MLIRFTALLLICGSGLVACGHGSTIISSGVRMQESRFWELVESAKGPGGDSEHANRLAAHLSQLSPKEIIEFQVRLDAFYAKAEVGAVWAAGTLLNKGHGTDSGFSFFRYWLIGQGESIYKAALENPDVLADLPEAATADDPSFAEWESFGFAAYEAYEALTGRVIYDDVPKATSNDPYRIAFDWHDFDDAFMERRLPRLWAKYGAEKQGFDRKVDEAFHTGPQSVTIEGLGVISVGDYLTHKTLGAGQVEFFFEDEPGVVYLIGDAPLARARIFFEKNGYPSLMLITKDSIHLWSVGK